MNRIYEKFGIKHIVLVEDQTKDKFLNNILNTSLHTKKDKLSIFQG